MRQERWRPVVGWEGIYEVSDLGRVRRIAPGKGTQVGRVLQAGIGSGGYPTVVLCQKPRKPTTRRVHDLVLQSFVGPRTDGHECRHLNGDPQDNRWPENLAWGTPKENGGDKVRHGTVMRGEAISSAKLTVGSAREICAWALEGSCTQEAIAIKYGVSPSRISYIKTGKNWNLATADIRAAA